ncbi:MAG: dTDP-4-dehydrorhamnose 3,5-epimerase [Cyclobacteriaceae bacterium]|jgi:dTDP-4-dehydrorhamnose 3,5-epimerase
MRLIETGFDDLFVIEPKVIEDERGYFMESYHYEALKSQGIDIHFVQDNQSRSRKGVLRGLHYQNAPYAQTKLIRTLSGSILDVALDLRREKSTFGKVFTLEISAQNKKQVLVPKGFAHGFLVLSDEAEILYKCDETYHPEAEGGIIYSDPDIEIDWGVSLEHVILSKRDQQHPTIAQAKFKF